MKKRSPVCKHFFTAKLRSVTQRTRHFQRSLFFILVLGVFLSSCFGLSNKAIDPMVPAPPGFTFDQYEVATGAAKHQTVLIGFFLGGTIAELATVDVDKNGNPQLRIYAFVDGVWVLRLDVPLRPEVLFIDVANIDGRDRLITYEHGRLSWFDPDLDDGTCLG